MNHDITFCADTIGCPYRFSCKRNPTVNKVDDDVLVSMQVFEHTETNCDYYLE